MVVNCHTISWRGLSERHSHPCYFKVLTMLHRIAKVLFPVMLVSEKKRFHGSIRRPWRNFCVPQHSHIIALSGPELVA